MRKVKFMIYLGFDREEKNKFKFIHYLTPGKIF